VEVGATALSQSGEISNDALDDIEIGDLDIIPITATLQFHFLKESAFSPYIGGGVAYILADDLDSGDLIEVGPIEIEDEFTWALQAGANINLSRSFAIGLDAKYISYTPGAAPEENREDEIDLDLNPLIFSAGVKFRW
jgi:outer membrane protein